MASQQLPSLTRGFRSRRSLGALVIGSMAGALIAVTTIPDGDGGEEQVEDTIVAAPETTTEPVVEEVVLETTVPEPEPFDHGDCPPDARACVDLDGERAWLQEKGEVTYDAVPIGQGGPGYETPRDTFHVSRKVEFDVSLAFDNAPMPFSVYFTNQGHAFHEGDPEGDSHGCVRLPEGVAEHFYNELEVYDKIVIY